METTCWRCRAAPESALETDSAVSVCASSLRPSSEREGGDGSMRACASSIWKVSWRSMGPVSITIDDHMTYGSRSKILTTVRRRGGMNGSIACGRRQRTEGLSVSISSCYLVEWLNKSAVTGMTSTFRAPHSSHMSLIVGTGGRSPGFATILFQHSRQTHFSCLVFPMVMSSLKEVATGPVPFEGHSFKLTLPAKDVKLGFYGRVRRNFHHRAGSDTCASYSPCCCALIPTSNGRTGWYRPVVSISSVGLLLRPLS